MTTMVPLLLVALLSATGCGRVGFTADEHGRAEGGMDARVDGAADTGAASVSTCGDGVVEGDELCDDGNRVSGDGCAADCDAREACGDGEVSSGELCDDGNGVDGDGCDNDCTPSCTTDPECEDGELCNGAETCSADGVCAAGTPVANGTTCSADLVCRTGSCAPLTCGDASIDAGEECDDGNDVDGDGCDNDCTYSCELDAECDDANQCTVDACGAANVCDPSISSSDGTPCDRDMDPVSVDICRGGTCLPSVCGDNFVDTNNGEQCDDDNVINGDGCDNDCTYSCQFDAECDDGEPCNGAETCGADNSCMRGTALRDGAVCNGTGRCASERCLMIFDAGEVDTGPPDTGGSTDGGSCPPVLTWDAPVECFQACTTSAECVEVQESCCCSCTQSGSNTAINSANTALWNQRQLNLCGSCRGRLCMDVIGNCPTSIFCNGFGLCEAAGGGGGSGS